jgi:hypothetical protein
MNINHMLGNLLFFYLEKFIFLLSNNIISYNIASPKISFQPSKKSIKVKQLYFFLDTTKFIINILSKIWDFH